VNGALERLLQILMANSGDGPNEMPVSLQENAALAAGRVGVWYPQKLAAHLGMVAPKLLDILSGIIWGNEKAQAMQGLSLAIRVQPAAIEASLLAYLREVSQMPSYMMLTNDRQPYATFQEVSCAKGGYVGSGSNIAAAAAAAAAAARFGL